MTTPKPRSVTQIEKRRRCLSDREIARIAARVFDGERRSDIAIELGVSASYLGRLIDDAKRRGVFRIVVSKPPPSSFRESSDAPNGREDEAP